ncbi:MAG: hypothetical protein GXP58_00825 [Deltaproteobacteria bacterium]|nr:hypothetical protein [Deltaproteobacteria bacterium]
MAAKNDIRNYCDSLCVELYGMKNRLLGFVDQVEGLTGKDKVAVHDHAGHLREIIKTIDWKLEILERACPFDWERFHENVESTASVPTMDFSKEKDFSGGYVGG